MILGCIAILLGAPFAAANWYSPFSQAITGKHVSGVPPVGGVLIGFGASWVSGSWWWALVGIPADFGLLFIVLASPWIVWEMFSRSRFALLRELRGWKDGRRAILKLYKDAGAELSYAQGSTQYRIHGTWVATDQGYQIAFDDYLTCELAKEGDDWVVESLQRSSNEDWHPDLNDFVFEPYVKAKNRQR